VSFGNFRGVSKIGLLVIFEVCKYKIKTGDPVKSITRQDFSESLFSKSFS
jgi:hypothetical protein